MNPRKFLVFGLLLITLSVSLSMQDIAPFDANAQTPQVSYVELFKFGRSMPRDISWQPNSNALAVATLEGVSLFSSDFQDELIIEGFPSGFLDITWSFNDNLVAGLKYTKTEVIIWNMQSASVQAIIQANFMNSMAWSHDNSKLATGHEDGTIKLWDAASGNHIATLNHGRSVHAISWSPDDTRLVSADRNDTARVWDVTTQTSEVSFNHSKDSIRDVVWSPVGNRIASVGHGSLMIWNPDDGQLISRLDGGYFVEWSPNGDRIFTKGANETVVMWEVATELATRTFAGHNGDGLDTIALSADGNYLAIGSDGIKTFENVQIWEVGTGTLVGVSPSFTQQVDSVAWSPDDRQVSSTHSDLLHLWDATTGQLATTIEFEWGYNLVWNHDWSWIAGAGASNTLEVWNIELQAPPTTVSQSDAYGTPGHDHPGGMDNLTWNPAGDRFATSAEDYTVRIWDVSDQSVTPSLVLWWGDDQNNGSFANDIAWSPDGNRIAVALNDGRVKIWDSTQLAEPLAVLPHGSDHVAALTWHPNGSSIISAYQHDPLYVWDATSYQPIATWPNMTDVNVFAWHPNADFLISGNINGSIQVWDAASGQLVDTFQAHAMSGITSLAWSHDGSKIASGSADGTVKIWGQVQD